MTASDPVVRGTAAYRRLSIALLAPAIAVRLMPLTENLPAPPLIPAA